MDYEHWAGDTADSGRYYSRMGVLILGILLSNVLFMRYNFSNDLKDLFLIFLSLRPNLYIGKH